MNDAPASTPRRRWPWKTLLVLLLITSTAAGAYTFYPGPEELLAQTWTLRTDLLAALRQGSTDDADRILREWRDVNDKLPTAVLLREGRVDDDVRTASQSLDRKLEDLQAALDGPPARVQALTLTALDEHRSCASIFYPVPEALAGSEVQAMPACHIGHQHPMLEVPTDLPVPTLEIEVHEDPKTGWNVHIITENFRFAPQHASLAHQPGEGHAHLYVDAVKIARVYGEWFHIASLPPGQHYIAVTLNSNNHDDLAVDGTVISAQTIVDVPDQRLAAWFGEPQAQAPSKTPAGKEESDAGDE